MIFSKTVAEFRGATGGRQWRRTVYQKISEEDRSITRLCRAAAVSGAGYYRFIQAGGRQGRGDKVARRDSEAGGPDAAYGYPRITTALQRTGW